MLTAQEARRVTERIQSVTGAWSLVGMMIERASYGWYDETPWITWDERYVEPTRQWVIDELLRQGYKVDQLDNIFRVRWGT